MLITGETVGLAEWIIDDTCLVFFISVLAIKERNRKCHKIYNVIEEGSTVIESPRGHENKAQDHNNNNNNISQNYEPLLNCSFAIEGPQG